MTPSPMPVQTFKFLRVFRLIRVSHLLQAYGARELMAQQRVAIEEMDLLLQADQP
jgi:hypothetical protein